MQQPDIIEFFNKWNRQMKSEGYHHPSDCKECNQIIYDDETCFCFKCEPLLGREFHDLTKEEQEGFKERILGGWED